jgi:Phage P22-like portal protein
MAKKPKPDKPLRAVSAPRKKTDAEQAAQAEEAFLMLARSRFKRCVEAEHEWRKLCLEDMKFSLGDQWPDQIKTARLGDDAPCLTVNRIAGFLRLLCNDERSQRLAIQVNPVGNGTDVKTAEVLQGYTRHVEQRSDADTVYDNCFEGMCRAGFKYARVLTEYADEESPDLDILIEGIRNAFTVYFDPSCKRPDYSDADFCFIIEDVPNDEFRGEYPDSDLASLSDFQTVGDQAPLWISHDSVKVAEYFYVVKEAYTVEGSDAKRYRRKVKWAKINAIETLDKKDWPGKYIPVVPDLGDDLDVDGKRYLAGAVRVPKDAQRAYNFWITSASEKIALKNKAQWLLASGQQEGFEKLWEHSNTKRLPFLIYKPVKIGEQVLPPPMEIDKEPQIGGMVEMIRQADNDLKATFGIFDASLGQKGPEESGEAIMARQKQTDVAILNYIDNHSRFIRQIGRIIVDLAPKIITAPKMQRIINPDGSSTHVGIYNSEFDTEEEARERLQELGADNEAIEKIYDVGTGEYDVTVSTGPSYQSRRQEASISMMKMVNAYPQLMQACADLIIKNMDWPEAQAMADRVRKMMPPQFFADAAQKDPKLRVQMLESQLQQMMQSHNAVVAELNKATDMIRTKRLEIDAKYQSDLLDARVTLLTTQAKILGEGALTNLKAGIDHISADMEMVRNMILQDKAAQQQQPIPPTQVTPPEQKQPDMSAGLLPPQPQVPPGMPGAQGAPGQ